jgi:hypothetical protein
MLVCYVVTYFRYPLLLVGVHSAQVSNVGEAQLEEPVVPLVNLFFFSVTWAKLFPLISAELVCRRGKAPAI